MKKELTNALLLQDEHDLRSAEVEEGEEGEGEGVEEKDDEWKCDFCHVGFASYQHASDHEATCEHQMLDHGAPVEIPAPHLELQEESACKVELSESHGDTQYHSSMRNIQSNETKQQAKSQRNFKPCMKMTPDRCCSMMGCRKSLLHPSASAAAETEVTAPASCRAGMPASSARGKTRQELAGLSKEAFGTIATAAADTQASNASGESSSLPGVSKAPLLTGEPRP